MAGARHQGLHICRHCARVVGAQFAQHVCKGLLHLRDGRGASAAIRLEVVAEAHVPCRVHLERDVVAHLHRACKQRTVHKLEGVSGRGRATARLSTPSERTQVRELTMGVKAVIAALCSSAVSTRAPARAAAAAEASGSVPNTSVSLPACCAVRGTEAADGEEGGRAGGCAAAAGATAAGVWLDGSTQVGSTLGSDARVAAEAFFGGLRSAVGNRRERVSAEGGARCTLLLPVPLCIDSPTSNLRLLLVTRAESTVATSALGCLWRQFALVGHDSTRDERG